MQKVINKMQDGRCIGAGGGKPKPSADQEPAIKATTCPDIQKKDNEN